MSYPEPTGPTPTSDSSGNPTECTPLVPLAGFAVAVSTFLIGQKRGIQQGNTIFVSPAMWDLLSHAESQEELRLLLNKIEVLRLPEVSFYSPVYTLVLGRVGR